MLDLRTKFEDFRAKRRENGDKGAGFVEYGAIILMIAAIAAGIWQFNLTSHVVGLMESGITRLEQVTGADEVETGDNDPEDDSTDPPPEE